MRSFKKVYVGNLNPDTDEIRLKDFFEDIGDIEHVSLVRDKSTGDSRGFAFITFMDPEDAEYTLSMNGHVLDGSTISINEAFERKQRNQHQQGPPSRGDYNQRSYEEDALEKALFEAQKALDKAFSLYRDRKSKAFR